MKKPLITIALICLIALVGFGETTSPLNSRGVANAMAQIEDFLDDNSSYYQLRLELHNVSGRVRDTDSITVRTSSNELYFIIMFRNEVLFRIWITKAATSFDESDRIFFDDSRTGGYSVRYNKSYERGDQWEIGFLFLNVFESFFRQR